MKNKPGTTYVDPLVTRGAVFEDFIDEPVGLAVLRQIQAGSVRLIVSYGVINDPYPEQGHVGPHFGVPPAYGYNVIDGEIDSLMTTSIYYLTDVASENGPTVVLPGSHKANFRVPKLGPGEAPPGAVEVHARAGSLLVFSESLVHWAAPNRSDQPRRIIVLGFAKTWMENWTAFYDPPADLIERSSDQRREILGAGRRYR